MLILLFQKIPSSDLRPQSPPSPIPEKSRSISLIEVKARGKFGAVWKATDIKELVAVKIMAPQVRFKSSYVLKFHHFTLKSTWNFEFLFYFIPGKAIVDDGTGNLQIASNESRKYFTIYCR